IVIYTAVVCFLSTHASSVLPTRRISGNVSPAAMVFAAELVTQLVSVLWFTIDSQLLFSDHDGIGKDTQTRTNIPGRWQNRHGSDGSRSTGWSDRRTRGHEENCGSSCQRRSGRDLSARWSREDC